MVQQALKLASQNLPSTGAKSGFPSIGGLGGLGALGAAVGGQALLSSLNKLTGGQLLPGGLGGGPFQKALGWLMGEKNSGNGSRSDKEWFERVLKSIYKILGQLGMVAGGEFKVAITEANRLKSTVLLGDQEGKITARLINEAVDLQELLKSLSSAKANHSGEQFAPPLLKKFHFDKHGKSFEEQVADYMEEMVESLKTREHASVLSSQLLSAHPKLHRILLEDRNAILTHSLFAAESKSMVAVVGLAHLEGVEALWLQGPEALPANVRRRSLVFYKSP
jgi:hypothetical protein